jgi:hypothetical protein
MITSAQKHRFNQRFLQPVRALHFDNQPKNQVDDKDEYWRPSDAQ